MVFSTSTHSFLHVHLLIISLLLLSVHISAKAYMDLQGLVIK